MRPILLAVAAGALALPLPAAGQAPNPAGWVPPAAELLDRPASELRDLVARFSADRRALNRRYDLEYSPRRWAALSGFLGAWRDRLTQVPFDRLGAAARIDHVLLGSLVEQELRQLRRDSTRFAEMLPVVPFVTTIAALHEARRDFVRPEPAPAAAVLAAMTAAIDSVRRHLDATPAARPTRIVALRAAEALAEFDRALDRWYGFHAGFDPAFTWWVRQPWQQADSALARYRRFLRETVVGVRPGADDPIVGDPIGREALVEDLAFEMIPYTPEELVAIAEREFAWCDAQMLLASRAMGFGDNWRAALEKVKTLHVGPGEQTTMVRDLALEATRFVEERGLVTVPPLARDIWRMEMLSPERQKVSPFFLGGEVIQVAFPTDEMSEADKQMSMRGNNIHFSRATVHHELIPGHHLQGFMAERYQPHRAAFATPFYSEGWSLYWEMLLWDLGFPVTPEQKVGMLFWRMHRAARIIFSLRFHLGEMTPDEAIDFLVNRVGHERANATAEVRRSFNGTYSPLYQIAYMMGGLQFRALHRELVESGRMTNRQFHDTILQAGNMPVEMVRAALTGVRVPRGLRSSWRFAGSLR